MFAANGMELIRGEFRPGSPQLVKMAKWGFTSPRQFFPTISVRGWGARIAPTASGINTCVRERGRVMPLGRIPLGTRAGTRWPCKKYKCPSPTGKTLPREHPSLLQGVTTAWMSGYPLVHHLARTLLYPSSATLVTKPDAWCGRIRY